MLGRLESSVETFRHCWLDHDARMDGEPPDFRDPAGVAVALHERSYHVLTRKYTRTGMPTAAL